MNPLFRHITKSLAGKLIITIGLLIIIGGGISWYILIDNGRKALVDNATQSTASYSELIRKGTRYAMLTFQRESIQHTIDNIGAAENVKRIRIFDSKGKIFYSSRHNEIGPMVDRSSTACIGCHSGTGKTSATLTGKNQWTIYEGSEGDRILAFVEPVYNESSCYNSSCHAHSPEQKVLGIIETDFSLSPVDKNIRKLIINTTIYALFFLSLSSLVLYFILRRFVLTPVSTLSDAMEKVASGDLNQMVKISSADEMSILSNTFNVMTEELRIARENMKNWTQTLEAEVSKKTEDLRKSQNKLIQAEKMASLGRLTADVAHEIRNPLTAIGGFARRLHKIVVAGKEKEYAEVVVTEVDRLEKILRDVLVFSREAKYHLERHNIGNVVRDMMKTYEGLCREQSINVEIKIEKDLPAVLLDMEQGRQAIANLITNAIDAMPASGTLTITAGQEVLHDAAYVFLKVSDTGRGIPENKLPFIFEPFFSTKEIGYGTGLGLSITRKIMEEHGGFIKAESGVEKGSSFSLYFPYQNEADSMKIRCWEYMKCRRDKDATIKCPAYPHFGRMCWAVAGTFCEGKAQGTFAQKYDDCRKCEFYQKMRNKEV
ncbi:MAG: HAMP domain-containing protein [Nitrospirae bacterium]|nr:HAMP domain-containing protein [Nitrospirota bacterium]